VRKSEEGNRKRGNLNKKRGERKNNGKGKNDRKRSRNILLKVA
jgi:hypothetical protein